MLLKALAFVLALSMMALFANAVYQHREKERARQWRFIHRLAVTLKSLYWEALEAEYVRLRIEQFGLDWWGALSAAHQNMVKNFVAGIYHDDEVVRTTAESLGIGPDSLVKLVGDVLLNYSHLIVAHEPYQRRILGKDSIYERMVVRIHHGADHEAVARVVCEPFLYDGSSGGHKFWVVKVQSLLDPEHFEYLALEDYSVIPLFGSGATFNGKNWLDHVLPIAEVEDEEEEEE